MKGIVLHWDQQSKVERFQDGDAVILDEERGRTHLLNATAMRIYDLCEGKTSEEIIREFLSSYSDMSNIEQNQLAEIELDAKEIILDFLREGILYEQQEET